MDERLRELAERVWRYHHMDHQLQKSDVIVVLCSHDTTVAERGAELFLGGWAPLLVFSGGLGAITKHLWTDPEANRFARVAMGMGVPEDRILIENRSTNTGENVALTRELLLSRGLDPASFLLVQKPYMERRTFATFSQVWPGKSVRVTSPQISMVDYLTRYSHESLTADDVISIMVGDLQRIREYPARGFQIPQEIPDDVWHAYNELVKAGFDRHLLRG